MLRKEIRILQDTYVANWYFPSDPPSDSNFGNQANVAISDTTQTLLKFDLDGIPNNAIVNKATLNLLFDVYSQEGSMTVTTKLIIGSWNKDSVTYNTRPPYGTTVSTTTLTGGDRRNIVKTFDITNAVKAWLEGISNNGIVLYGNASAYHEISSSRASDVYPFVSIEYTLPASKPINLNPIAGSVIDIGNSNTFSWEFVEAYEGDVQTEYELLYSYNSSSWTTVKGTTATQHIFNVGSLTAEGSLWWKVRTKNKDGNWSEFSSAVQINLKRKPITPEVTTPSTVTVSRPIISWTTPSEQYAYEVEIWNSNTKVWGSGKVISTDKQAIVSVDLSNNITYTAKVKVHNKYNDASDWGTKNIRTNFNLPNAPIISIIEAEGKSILVSIVNPAGGETVIRNDVYRSIAGQDKFELIGSVVNGEFKDYSLKCNVWYEYKVRVVGSAGGFNDSEIQAIRVKFKNTFISNSKNFIELKFNPSRDISYAAEKSYFNFVGRKHRVSEYGEFEDTNINCSFLCNGEQLEGLKQLYYSREDLYYRDGRERALKVSMDSLSSRDYPRKMNLFEVSISFSEVD